jgi:catechol 2,3-dioxygenase-like lactoylglutathione lyase family enzyme
MIQRLSHSTVYVLDQERAKQFYAGKLGFDVRDDVNMGPFRWLTVSPKGQRDLEIVLMAVAPSPLMDEARAKTLRALVEQGTFGCGVLETADVMGDYRDLKAKGVEFRQPPEDRPYGKEAIFRDDSGNWFSLVQRPG